MLEIRLLGTFELRCRGRIIALPARLAQSLLAYLVLNRGTAHRREKLAGIFWPDASEDRARASLRQELWRIRKALSAGGAVDALISDDLTVAFAPSSGYGLDIRDLEQLADDASIEQLTAALSAYRGEFLPGFYEDWVVSERERLQLLFEKRLSRLLDLLEAKERWSDMAEWAERWLSFGQNPDAAYRSLMIAYAGLGDRVKVLATYDRCVNALAQLGLQPSDEIRSLAEMRGPALLLPPVMTTFVGRERELHAISDLLLTSRLTTLTGSGGVGKTRLAIEVTRLVASRFPDGVSYLDLSSLQDSALVPSMLLSLLYPSSLADGERSVTDLLQDYFRSRRALIVMDNCEHLIEACARLAASLVAACPGLRILATSREALRVGGEAAYRVPALDIPSASEDTPLSELAKFDSIRLFADRAIAHVPGFSLTSSNAASIAQICRRLDGIPLAIELAAGRVRSLTVDGILHNLNDRFALLTGGLRTEMPHHQTLRALIDWSHDLLSDPERALLRRLAVFAGGCTLDAAQKVCSGVDLTESDILTLLPELVEKSLVTFDSASGRYHMSETIREYALDRLAEAGEQTAVRGRHLDYFVDFAEAAQRAPRTESARLQLAADQENCLSAIQWCEIIPDGTQQGLRLVAALRSSWTILVQYELGYRLVRTFLERPGAEPRNLARAGALLTLAQLGNFLGYSQSVTWAAEESLSIAREVGDPLGESLALRWLASLLGEVGDHVRAFKYFEESLAVARNIDDARLLYSIQNDMAEVLRAEGDLAAAEALYEQGLDIGLETTGPHDLIVCVLNLSTIAILRGNLPLARQRLLEVLRLMGEVPYGLSDAPTVLGACAALLAASGEWRRAAIVFGASQQRSPYGKRVLDRADHQLVDPLMDQTCKALGDAEFELAHAEGRRLTLEKAVAQARSWLGSLP